MTWSGLPDRFEIGETVGEYGMRLTVSGDLDLAVSHLLAGRLQALADERRPTVLDLSEVEFMDSSGLNLLIAYHRLAALDDWDFRIERQFSDQVRKLLELTGMESFLGGSPNYVG